ncbi:MAG: response regulator transcription factor [Actinobacteria bacterium]|nr:response regulator transcription factor [Actinomycetota bacterium]
MATEAQPERFQRVAQAAIVTTVLAADDRPLIHAGIRAILSGSEHIDLTEGVAISDAVAAVERHRPDVLIVAVRENDPDPFHAIATAKALSEDLRVLVLADGSTVIDLREAVIAGVDSFLLTTATEEDIRDAVARTAAGERVVSPQVAMQLAGSWRPATGAEAPASVLTPRELEVLQLLAEGLTNQGIAKRLDLSARTVKTHVQNLLAKLDVPDRTGAVARGFRLNLIR